jgi:hypothetical protein
VKAIQAQEYPSEKRSIFMKQQMDMGVRTFGDLRDRDNPIECERH